MDVDIWQQHNDDAKWVQRHRHEIAAETGKLPPRRLPELDSWLENHKGAVTQKLQTDTTDTDTTESEADTDE